MKLLQNQCCCLGSALMCGCVLRVQSIPDMTGREDLVSHLRSHLLLATAQRLGCTKVARGDCADTLAMKLISEAAKVREQLGYQLWHCFLLWVPAAGCLRF
jgi:hypothetical protein